MEWIYHVTIGTVYLTTVEISQEFGSYGIIIYREEKGFLLKDERRRDRKRKGE